MSVLYKNSGGYYLEDGEFRFGDGSDLVLEDSAASFKLYDGAHIYKILNEDDTLITEIYNATNGARTRNGTILTDSYFGSLGDGTKSLGAPGHAWKDLNLSNKIIFDDKAGTGKNSTIDLDAYNGIQFSVANKTALKVYDNGIYAVTSIYPNSTGFTIGDANHKWDKIYANHYYDENGNEIAGGGGTKLYKHTISTAIGGSLIIISTDSRPFPIIQDEMTQEYGFEWNNGRPFVSTPAGYCYNGETILKVTYESAPIELTASLTGPMTCVPVLVHDNVSLNASSTDTVTEL